MHGLPLRSSPPLKPYAAIVDEALSAVLAPERRGDVLFDALTTAGLPEIPERPASMRIFVEGALFTALTRQLDVGDALEITAQIRSALTIAMGVDERPISDIRERVLGARPTRALVLTQASLVVYLLQDMIGDQLDVLSVRSEGELTDRLEETRGPVLVIIDLKHACVDLEVCEQLRSELGPDSTIVWWGASALDQSRIERRLGGGPQTLACDYDVRLADLGDLCRELLLR